jgi:hypothetical protein
METVQSARLPPNEGFLQKIPTLSSYELRANWPIELLVIQKTSRHLFDQ